MTQDRFQAEVMDELRMQDEQMTKDKALKLAIEGYEECLENLQGWAAYASEYFQDKWDLEGEVKDHKDKINACKEALEQPAMPNNCRPLEEVIAEYEKDPAKKEALDKARVRFREWLEQPAQEPYAYEITHLSATSPPPYFVRHNPVYKTNASTKVTPLYTHPHQWQGLTDDEMEKVFESIETSTTHRKIYRAIEAKLKEKNNG